MFLSSKFDLWHIYKVSPFSKKYRYLKSLGKIGVAGYGAPIIFEKKDQETKILAVAELKNINSASCNEHLKIGKKREKIECFVTSDWHHRRRGGHGGTENFFGNSTFYASQHPKIWSNSER